MGTIKDFFSKQTKQKETENPSMPKIKKELIEEVENQQEQETSGSLAAERGVLLFHDTEGTLRFEQIGEVSLENITYYLRYLEEIEKNLWKEKTGARTNA